MSLNAKVVDLMYNGKWMWPKTLTDAFDELLLIDTPELCQNKANKVIWRTNAGRHKDFSVSTVWNDMR